MAHDPFADLPDKDRTPRSARMLDAWVRDAQDQVGSRGNRVGWLLASTIVAASLQRELEAGTPVFLLKGGMFIERALNLKARATKDLDALYRGEEEDLEDQLDRALVEPWGEIQRNASPHRALVSSASPVPWLSEGSSLTIGVGHGSAAVRHAKSHCRPASIWSTVDT